MTLRCAISDLDHVSRSDEEEVFASAGLSYALHQCKTEDDLIAQMQGVGVVMNQYAPFTERVFAALPDLKCVVRYGVGVNHIDLEAAARAGVHVCNVPDYGMQEVSDHALTLSMALMRRLIPMNNDTHAGGWAYEKAIPIRRASEVTIGVMGLGRIGALYAQKMGAIGYRIIGHDPVSPMPEGVEAVSQEALIERADLLALFCPLLPQTRHLIRHETISRMKQGAFVVNCSRGGLIAEDDLAEALRAGRLGGAAIDVTEREPLQADSPLRGIESCILTPHMAWYSEEAGHSMKRKCAQEAIRFLKGEPLYWDLTAKMMGRG